jgi:uncharacterized protein
MKKEIFATVHELKRLLASAVPLVDVRVFGSYARGEEESDSDLDVFIEIETLSRQSKKIIRELSWRIGLEHGMVISPLIFGRYEIERSPLRSSPIIENIMREGISV